MRKVLLSITLACFTLCAFAQSNESKSSTIDPLDVSKQLEQIELYGVPTFENVNEMRTKADALYEDHSWAKAAEAYEQYAKHANWLANIVSQCVEPYYSASYDDRKNVSYTSLKDYIPYESAANKLKEGRNEAYVKIGLCYKNLGDVNKAMTFLHKGLDLLDLRQRAMWAEAAKAVAEIVGFVPEK